MCQKDDLISRQAAIKRATKDHDFYKGATIPTDKARRDELLNVMCWLGELPSAQPKSYREGYHAGFKDAQSERKRGRWNCSDDMYESAVCSVCGWDTTEPWDHICHWFNFCPNCGADMREVDE